MYTNRVEFRQEMLLDKYNDVEAYELSHVGIDKFVVPKIAHISKSKILFF